MNSRLEIEKEYERKLAIASRRNLLGIWLAISVLWLVLSLWKKNLASFLISTVNLYVIGKVWYS